MAELMAKLGREPERERKEKPSRRPDAIVFDWDNTLVDTLACVEDATNVTRSAFGLPTVTADDVQRFSARSARDLFRDWFGGQAAHAHELFYARYCQMHLTFLRPMPGAHALLSWLKETGIPAFVVSNKRGDILRQEAAHLGWGSMLVALVGSMDAPKDKPAREPVDMALARFDKSSARAELSDRTRVWFVGDTDGDVACARASGCRPVLLRNAPLAASLGVDLAFPNCQAFQQALYTLE